VSLPPPLPTPRRDPALRDPVPARQAVVVEGRISWRLKTPEELRRERPVETTAPKPKGFTPGFMRDKFEGQPPRFAAPGPRRVVNTCEECQLPIGAREPGEAMLCVWRRWRREQSA